MISVRKKFKFFLYMFLVKIRLKTESSAFHRLAHSVRCTFFEINVLFSYGNSWSRGIIKGVRPGTQKQVRWRLMAPTMCLFLNFTVIFGSPFVLNVNTVAETVNHLVAHSSSFSSFTWKEMCYFNNRKQAFTQSSTISLDLSAWSLN